LETLARPDHRAVELRRADLLQDGSQRSRGGGDQERVLPGELGAGLRADDHALGNRHPGKIACVAPFRSDRRRQPRVARPKGYAVPRAKSDREPAAPGPGADDADLQGERGLETPDLIDLDEP